MMGLLKQINLSSSSSSCSSVRGKSAANTKPVPPYYTMHSHPELIQLLPLLVPLRVASDGALPCDSNASRYGACCRELTVVTTLKSP